jgi:predicted Rossmann fold nucleotide-binding protein DprA/Smf involved in DNA uptake
VNASLGSELRGLADRVAAAGALVSASWPDTPHVLADLAVADRLTTSLALGTVMVDADATGGADHKARTFLAEDGPLFIPRPLANAGPIAGYARHPNAVVVGGADEVAYALPAGTAADHAARVGLAAG